MRRITSEELRRLRNDVPVEVVVGELRIERRARGRRRDFRCPACNGFHGAIHTRQNLTRYFRCERNFNPIDLVMAVRQTSFLDAVRELREIAGGTSVSTLPSWHGEEEPVVKPNTIW